MISSHKNFENNMSLSKEEAHRRADQIIQDAEQASIQRRNLKAKHVRMPLLLVRNKKLAQLQPYQRVQLINQAKEMALDHPAFNKALYVYLLSAILFFKYVMTFPNNPSPAADYFLVLLGLGVMVFELYRSYLVNVYLKQLLQR